MTMIKRPLEQNRSALFVIIRDLETRTSQRSLLSVPAVYKYTIRI